MSIYAITYRKLPLNSHPNIVETHNEATTKDILAINPAGLVVFTRAYLRTMPPSQFGYVIKAVDQLGKEELRLCEQHRPINFTPTHFVSNTIKALLNERAPIKYAE